MAVCLPIPFFTDYDRKSNLVSDVIEISLQTLSFEEIFNRLSRLFYYSFEVIVNLVDFKELCNSLKLDNSFFTYIKNTGIIQRHENEICLTNKGKYYLSVNSSDIDHPIPI
jgi:predicted methyltransferase